MPLRVLNRGRRTTTSSSYTANAWNAAWTASVWKAMRESLRPARRKTGLFALPCNVHGMDLEPVTEYYGISSCRYLRWHRPGKHVITLLDSISRWHCECRVSRLDCLETRANVR